MKPRTYFQTAFRSAKATGSYSVPRARAPIDLWLDANEGRTPPEDILQVDTDAVRRYPSKTRLESMLAEKVGVDATSLVVTNGGDDAIDRICRGFLEAGRNLVMTSPGFEMISTYAQMTGADVRRVDWWGGPFPWAEIQANVDDSTAVVAVVSPNNPTGEVVATADVVAFAHANPSVLIMLDLAYTEFASEDAQSVVNGVANIVTIRTLSKAYGLAGLRVGYAVGDMGVINVIRAAGGPYPVSAASLAFAERALESMEIAPYIERVGTERTILRDLFHEMGVKTTASKANFIFAEIGDGQRFRDGMAGFGIGIRAWPGRKGPDLDGWVRVTCPGHDADFSRLIHSINSLQRPEALIFDMDGVLVDVSSSYRQAIVRTAASYGVEVGPADIAAQKAKGNANNDWQLTLRLLAAAGVTAELDEVTSRFEDLYQGVDSTPGLWTTEKPLTNRRWISALKDRGYALGVVTGRPRRDAERLIDQFGFEGLFETMICMEDGPLKPDPWPIQAVMQAMSVKTAWMFGDTRDDMVSSRAAGVLPFGVLAPGDTDEDILFQSGAGFVVQNVEDIEALLPELG